MFRAVWQQAKQEFSSADQDRLASLANDQSKDRLIVNFLSVPAEIEKLMLYGYLVCLDAFLATLTFFPVRFSIAIAAMFWRYFQFLCRRRDFASCSIPLADLRLILQGLLLIISCYLVLFIDTSQLYHSIRGQSVIKLYVIFNVLEIADRLCCSFGQDILDALLNGLRTESSLPPLPNFLLALVYVFGHTLVLFYQMVTLNVAINSHNNALLTLLVSNQFVEIKGSVFKKFEKENLFQLSCSDIVERFQLSVYLAIITFRNVSEFGAEWSVFSLDIPSQLGSWAQPVAQIFSKLIESPLEMFSEIPSQLWLFLSQTVPQALHDIIAHPFTFSLDIDTYYSLFDALVYPVLIVFATEVLVDWIKHAFISKFNHIRPAVYSKYLSVLCKDYVLGPGKIVPVVVDGQFVPPPMANNSIHVARRIGFAAIPLACLLIRILLQTVASTGWTKCYSTAADEGLYGSFSSHRCSYVYSVTALVIMPLIFILKCILSIGLSRFSFERYVQTQTLASGLARSHNNNNSVVSASEERRTFQNPVAAKPPLFSSSQRRLPSHWDLDDVPHISRLYSFPASPEVSSSIITKEPSSQGSAVFALQRAHSAAPAAAAVRMEPSEILNSGSDSAADSTAPTPNTNSETPTPILDSVDRFTMLTGRIP